MNFRLITSFGFNPQVTLPSPPTRRKGVSVPIWAVVLVAVVLALLVGWVLL